MKPQMQFIPFENVVVPEDRIRRDFDKKAMLDLAVSIWKLGQLQPIVLRDDGVTLICGERRLRTLKMLSGVGVVHEDPEVKAFLERLEEEGLDPFEHQHPDLKTQLQLGNIGAVLRHNLSAQQLLEAELEENLHRADLTWQEQAKAKAALHKLRVAQHGEYNRSTKEGWTAKDTAEEIAGRAPTSNEKTAVTEALLLDNFLDDPMVAAAPTERDALKIVRNLTKERQRAEAAKNFDPVKAIHVVNHGDAYEWLASLEPGTADCVHWDPPYGRGMHKHGFAKKHEYDDSDEALKLAMVKGPPLLYRAMKEQAHAYIFCDLRKFDDWLVNLAVAGFDVWPVPIIWDKGNVGTYGNHELGPRHCYDAIVFANKGKRPTTALYRDIIPINQEQGLEHPAGKPVPLIVDLLKRTVTAGDVVIDPMCGGGTFFEACTQVKVKGLGNEGVEKWYHTCLEVISGGKK